MGRDTFNDMKYEMVDGVSKETWIKMCCGGEQEGGFEEMEIY